MTAKNEIPQEHDWVKTNEEPVKVRGGKVYDMFKCRRCKITGRKQDTETFIAHDSKFRGLVYLRCDTAMAHIQGGRRTGRKPRAILHNMGALSHRYVEL